MIKWLFVLFLALCLFIASPHNSLAANIWDPKPAMSWDEMVGCELVIVARYQSHETADELRAEPSETRGLTKDKKQTMTLRIERVLKGQNLKAGDLLRVDLLHWYTIEMGDSDPYNRIIKPDGIPRLCYKYQPNNPGGLVPLQIVPDVRQDTIYFFPKADAPALERSQQVQKSALETGWGQALKGEKTEIPFGLAQSVSTKLQRDALEELGAARTPATLDLLFDWLVTSQQFAYFGNIAERALMAIGDQNGDVYNRAAQRLSLVPDDWIPYSKMTPVQRQQYYADTQKNAERVAFSRYARIMAEVNGERAVGDFARTIESGSPVASEIAGEALGFTYIESAVDFSFRLLAKPKTALMGASALQNLLTDTYSSTRNQRRQIASLREIVKPRLAKALQQSVFDESRTEAARDEKAPEPLRSMRRIRESLEAIVISKPEPTIAPVDLVHAEQVLLRSDAKTFEFGGFVGGEFVQGEGLQLLKDIRDSAEPRFIPLLVTMMRTVTWGIRTGEFQGTVQQYVTLYPNAFKREMEKQGLTPEFYEKSPLHGYGFDARVLAMLGNPTSAWTLSWPDDARLGARKFANDFPWINRYTVSPKLRSNVVESIRYDLGTRRIESVTPLLRFLLSVDPDAAQPLLEKALEMRNSLSRHDRASLLGLAVGNGHPELLNELLALVSVAAKEERERAIPKYDPTDLGTYYASDADFRVLLWAKQPLATELYLKLLDTKLSDIRDDSSFFYRRVESPTPDGLLQALFAEHPQAFFEHISRSLASPSLGQRKMAERILQNTLYWNLDFEAQALASERSAKLEAIKPLLLRMGGLSEPELRVFLLERLGVTLPKAPEERQKLLLQQTSSSDYAISQNAMRLLGSELGDDSVEGLAGLTPTRKEVAFKNLLADRATF